MEKDERSSRSSYDDTLGHVWKHAGKLDLLSVELLQELYHATVQSSLPH